MQMREFARETGSVLRRIALWDCFRMLSLILLAITRLHRNWVKIRPSNSPTMQ